MGMKIYKDALGGYNGEQYYIYDEYTGCYLDKYSHTVTNATNGWFVTKEDAERVLNIHLKKVVPIENGIYTFKYNGGSNPGVYRVVYVISQDNRRILGYDLRKQENRSYLKSRIEDCKPLPTYSLSLPKAIGVEYSVNINRFNETDACLAYFDNELSTLYYVYEKDLEIVQPNPIGVVDTFMKDYCDNNDVMKQWEILKEKLNDRN